MPSTTESASRPQQRTVPLGVTGLALSHQAISDLAIAHLRPTIPEHGTHRHQYEDMHLVLVLPRICDELIDRELVDEL